MNGFEATLRAEFEPLQFAAFFGALILLGVLEPIAALGAEDVARRKRWPANFGLTAVNVLIIRTLPVASLAVADIAAASGWGLLNQIALPALVAVIAAFLLRSLTSYVIHVAMHKVPLFWRLHRVHHTDTAMDISTAVRFHPLEFVISIPVVLVATLTLGFPPVAVIIYALADAAMAVFSHANIRLPGRIEQGVRLFLVTPAMHRIHHSASQRQTDSNYGATLSCWDRLFGTYRALPEAHLAGLRLGLAQYGADSACSLWWLLRLPFRNLESGERAPTEDRGLT